MFSAIGAIEEQLINQLKPGDIKLPDNIELHHVLATPTDIEVEQLGLSTLATPTNINVTEI